MNALQVFRRVLHRRIVLQAIAVEVQAGLAVADDLGPGPGPGPACCLSSRFSRAARWAGWRPSGPCRPFRGDNPEVPLHVGVRELGTGADGVVRTRAERGHARPLATVFGQVRVTRLAYRAPGAANVHPLDAELNLPEEKQSHGLRMRRDQGVRARFVADGEVVLEQWIQFLGRLTIDSCRVELVPLERGYGQRPSAGGTELVCHFFVPAAKQAAKVVTGLFMLVLGLGLAVGILRDARADAGRRDGRGGGPWPVRRSAPCSPQSAVCLVLAGACGHGKAHRVPHRRMR